MQPSGGAAMCAGVAVTVTAPRPPAPFSRRLASPKRRAAGGPPPPRSHWWRSRWWAGRRRRHVCGHQEVAAGAPGGERGPAGGRGVRGDRSPGTSLESVELRGAGTGVPAVLLGGLGGLLRSRPGAEGAGDVWAVGGGSPCPRVRATGAGPDLGTHPAGFGGGPETGLGAREGPRWV